MTTGSNATAMPGLPGLGVTAVLGAMFWFGFALFLRFPEPFGLFAGWCAGSGVWGRDSHRSGPDSWGQDGDALSALPVRLIMCRDGLF